MSKSLYMLLLHVSDLTADRWSAHFSRRQADPYLVPKWTQNLPDSGT